MIAVGKIVIFSLLGEYGRHVKPYATVSIRAVRDFSSKSAVAYSRFSLRMPAESEAHVRFKSNSDEFKLLFFMARESNANAGNEEFCFHRKLTEPIGALLNRLRLKIDSEARKRNKKVKIKNAVDSRIEIASTRTAQFLKNGTPVSDAVACKDVFLDEEDDDRGELVLVIDDRRYAVKINHPWIENIKLPDCIMAGFAVYPRKLVAHFADENESEFLWFKSDSLHDAPNTKPAGTGPLYIPSFDEINRNLRLVCTPIINGVRGLSVNVVSATPVQAGPGPCPFEDRHSFTKDHLSGDSFRVVSYNILADLYATSTTGKNELFPYCADYWLALDYRKQLLLKELTGYKADLICLQEVDCRIFDYDLKKVLRNVGMDGFLSKKGGKVNEGIACFYNKSRFSLLSSHSFVLGQDSRNNSCLADIWKVIDENELLSDQMNCRTTAVQILAFDFLSSDKVKRKIVVANTHLYFHPEADHVRLLQATMCLKLIDDIVDNLKSQEADSIVSIIFCGDFNSTPDCDIYRLFTADDNPKNYREWNCGKKSVDGSPSNNRVNFKSACGTPDFTNYTEDFKACLDYIFYQADLLKVNQVIPFPSEEELSRFVAIPSVVFPSDHVALVADLAWK